MAGTHGAASALSLVELGVAVRILVQIKTDCIIGLFYSDRLYVLYFSPEANFTLAVYLRIDSGRPTPGRFLPWPSTDRNRLEGQSEHPANSRNSGTDEAPCPGCPGSRSASRSGSRWVQALRLDTE